MGTDSTSEKLFSVGWTGGPSAVSVSVYTDHAKVTRWNDSRAKNLPLTTEQVSALQKIWQETQSQGDTACATAVALEANRLTSYAIGSFSSEAGGDIGDWHTRQMESIEEAARWSR
ncbi:hypothetical protein [Azospirillum sp. sgz302134]